MSLRAQRVLLAVLFVIVGGLQLRLTITTLAYLTSTRQVPSVVVDVDPAKLSLDSVNDVAAHAGVQKNDVLLAVNGVAVDSWAEARRALLEQPPGHEMKLRLQRGHDAPFEVRVPVKGRRWENWWEWLTVLMLNVFTPWCCLLLGFLVAFQRTGDPVAYAVLAALLFLSQIDKAEGSLRGTWEPFFLAPAYFLDNFSSNALAVTWLWFALLFPDPCSRHQLLPWARWAVGCPFLAFSFIQSVLLANGLFHRQYWAWVAPLIGYPNWFFIGVYVFFYGLGFTNLVYKLVRETQPTLRRRLQWLILGLAVGLLPLVTMFFTANVLHRDADTFPYWILLPTLVSPIFVPLTLAYAVLVERLFDVGIVVRQGLLAAKTVTIIRFMLLALLIWPTYVMAARRDVTEVNRWAVIVVCVIGIVLVRRGAERLQGWVDRRFFREAVNSEHLLVELSEEVRRIADPQLLLHTVTERISSALHASQVVAFVPNATGFVPAYAGGGRTPPETLLPFSHPLVRQLREERQPVTVDAKDSSGPMPLGTEVLLPLSTSQELYGILSLGQKRSEEPYSRQDIRLLSSVANQTALALDNSQLTAKVAAEAAHRERLNSELEIARQVQQRLFPKAAPEVAGLQLAGHCRPAQSIGGDYYDFLLTPTGEVGLAIGDIAGKGIPAALLMAGLQASLRALTLAGITDLGELMQKLNRLVYDATPANRFATFFYGLYDPATRRLRFACAGHNPALLYRPAGERQWLKSRGVGLGLSRGSRFETGEFALGAGDCVVLYTDGLTEALNAAGEEFGEERLAETVRTCKEAPADKILDCLLREVTAFAEGATQHDDITVIVARAI